MTRDVYAGDQGSSAEALRADPTKVTTIHIRAEPQPDILLRIAAVLNLFNSAPQAVNLRRDAEETVTVDISMRNCSEFIVDMVCRKLAQLTCVIDVSTGAKPE